METRGPQRLKLRLRARSQEIKQKLAGWSSSVEASIFQSRPKTRNYVFTSKGGESGFVLCLHSSEFKRQ